MTLSFLKDNVFVASCTSADDEFEFNSLEEDVGRSTKNIKVMISTSGKKINMMANGNAINFVYGGVNGPYIYAVQAGLIASCLKLIRKQAGPAGQISDLPVEVQKTVATTWLRFFS